MKVSNAAISHSQAESQKRNAAVPQASRLHQTSAAGILPATITAGGTPAVRGSKTAGGTPAVQFPVARASGMRSNTLEKRGWHSRGYLPHWDPGNRPIHLVLRLFDSLPQHLLALWEQELKSIPDMDAQRRLRIESALDQSLGKCWLQQPNVAQIVADALAYFDGQRYSLRAWVIMPNHVHAMITPLAPATLSSIGHSWKSFTAKRVNKRLGLSGAFWQKENFDRVMRDQDEVLATKAYIEANPVAAGLCRENAEWPWSSAYINSAAGVPPASKGAAGRRPACNNNRPDSCCK